MIFYYGGLIKTQEPISILSLDKILDLIDEYILLVEAVEMQEIEYRGYIIKRDSSNVKVYDKQGNFLKQTAFSSKGAVTDMKIYIDNLIKRYGQ